MLEIEILFLIFTSFTNIIYKFREFVFPNAVLLKKNRNKISHNIKPIEFKHFPIYTLVVAYQDGSSVSLKENVPCPTKSADVTSLQKNEIKTFNK